MSHSHTPFEIYEPKFPEKSILSQNFNLKPSLEFNQGWTYSRTLFHSTENRSIKDSAPLNPRQIFSLFRKWYNRASKVLKSTTYAISSDVIGHDAIPYSDIALERYGLKLLWLKVMSIKHDLVRIYRHFFEPLFRQKFSYKCLTPICDILGMSWSVICGQKIHSHIFGPDDVIHRYKFFTLCWSETSWVALTVRHLVLSRDVITKRYHVMNTNVPENPGIWWSVICGQKIHCYFLPEKFLPNCFRREKDAFWVFQKKNMWIFCPQMTLHHIPDLWILCPQFTDRS